MPERTRPVLSEKGQCINVLTTEGRARPELRPSGYFDICSDKGAYDLISVKKRIDELYALGNARQLPKASGTNEEVDLQHTQLM